MAKIKDYHFISCVICGANDKPLVMLAHRHSDNQPIVGFVFVCKLCFEKAVERELEIVLK